MKIVRMEMLFLIWVVPLLALIFWYGLAKRRRLLAAFAFDRNHSALMPAQAPVRRLIQAVLVLAAVVFLVVAAAGPQYGFQWQPVEREGVDIVIALDCSRSMLSADIQPTRLDRAKREIIDLLTMLQGDRVALTAFSGTAFLQCPLTLDYAAFDLFLNVLTPDYLPVGGTDLTAAVQTAVSAFDPQSAADKAVILITDGENTGRGDPLAAAGEAQKAGVKLFCIGVGAEQGVPVPAAGGGFEKDRNGQIVLSRLDETLLSRMALATGGTYVRSVAGDMDLDAIYHDRIRSDLKTATVESSRKQVWADRFQWPLVIAVILLALAMLLPLTSKALVVLITAGALLGAAPNARAGPLQQGYQAYEKGDYEQALKSFIQGQLDDPDNPRVLYNLGNAYYQNGDFAAAREHYLQALTRLPGDDANGNDAIAAMKAQLHYNLGNAAFRQGELQAALKDYESALKLLPDDVQAKENLDFVKRQLEQQKKQQPQQQSKDGQEPSDPQDGQQESPPEASRSDAQKQESNGRQPPDPQGGPPPEPQPDDPAAADDQAHHDPENGGEQPPQEQTRAGESARNQDQDGEPQEQAAGARMLNRLKDEPGRAMMPNYQKRQVEKDW